MDINRMLQLIVRVPSRQAGADFIKAEFFTSRRRRVMDASKSRCWQVITKRELRLTLIPLVLGIWKARKLAGFPRR